MMATKPANNATDGDATMPDADDESTEEMVADTEATAETAPQPTHGFHAPRDTSSPTAPDYGGGG